MAEMARKAILQASKEVPAWDCSCDTWLNSYANEYANQLKRGE